MSRKWPIGVVALAAVLCPLLLAWWRFQLWRNHEEDAARHIARSKADAESERYMADFVDALNKGMTVEQIGLRSVSRGRDHGDQLVAHFRERYESEHRNEPESLQGRRWALAEYLHSAEARNEASRIGIPPAVLSAASKQFP